MDLELKGKVALITGSSKGIGKGIANVLKDEGCEVILNARNNKELQKTANSLKVKNFLTADVTNPDDCKYLVNQVTKQFNKLDILVCNVGSGSSVSVGNESLEEWNRVFLNNFFSTTNVVEAFKNLLIKSKGTIICISSIAGMEVIGSSLTYLTAKASLNAYVKGISKYFGKKRVRINTIAPGNVMFDGSVWEKQKKHNPALVKNVLSQVPSPPLSTKNSQYKNKNNNAPN